MLNLFTLNRCSPAMLVALVIFDAACGGQPPTESVVTDLPAMDPVTLDTTEAVIVTSDPLSSDATCTISEEPTLIIGDNEYDEHQ